MAWASPLVYQQGMRWQGVVVGLALGLALGAFAGAVFSEPIRRVVLGQPPTPAVDAHAFDALNRAATAVEQSLNVGVNFQGFSEHVQTLATEVALAGSAARTDQERAMLIEYSHALDDYRDSVNIWNRSLERYFSAPPDIIEKFQIPAEHSISPTLINQAIWTEASSHLQAARQLAKSPGAPSP